MQDKHSSLVRLRLERSLAARFKKIQERMVGNKFNHLTVMRYSHSRNRERFWECLCDCGTTTYVRTSFLLRLKTKSCGCAKSDRMANRDTGKTFDELLINQRFGLLVVVGKAGVTQNGCSLWRCRCDCGNEKLVTVANLGNSTNSCGCLKSENGIQQGTVHGLSYTPEWGVLRKMIERCYNSNCPAYKYYGGRGIKICDRWLGSDGIRRFVDDLGPRPNEEMTIERIDVNGDYEPSNCTWLHKSKQARNTRKTVRLTFNGRTMSISDWAEEIGLSRSTVYARWFQGMPIDEVLYPALKRVKRTAQ